MCQYRISGCPFHGAEGCVSDRLLNGLFPGRAPVRDLRISLSKHIFPCGSQRQQNLRYYHETEPTICEHIQVIHVEGHAATAIKYAFKCILCTDVVKAQTWIGRTYPECKTLLNTSLAENKFSHLGPSVTQTLLWRDSQIHEAKCRENVSLSKSALGKHKTESDWEPDHDKKLKLSQLIADDEKKAGFGHAHQLYDEPIHKLVDHEPLNTASCVQDPGQDCDAVQDSTIESLNELSTTLQAALRKIDTSCAEVKKLQSYIKEIEQNHKKMKKGMELLIEGAVTVEAEQSAPTSPGEYPTNTKQEYTASPEYCGRESSKT